MHSLHNDRSPRGGEHPHLLQSVAIVAAVLSLSGCTQRAGVPVIEATTAAGRAQERAVLKERIRAAIDLPINDTTEGKWREALWAAEFTRDTSAATREALARAWSGMQERSLEFQRSLLEAAQTLAADSFRERARAYLDVAPNEKLFAMAAWLVRPLPLGAETIRRAMEDRFPHWREHPILSQLVMALEPLPPRPPLVDLLNAPFPAGAPVLFSFQRHQRVYPGIAVLRLPSGKFLRENDGQLFVISQLALSLSNLPGFLTNGNTPQGIHTMQGTAVSTDPYIGPTTMLVMKLPVEAPPAEFFHQPMRDTAWTADLYASLLPPSWRAYPPITEAYDAGRAGRFDILAHGTTIDPSYYRGELFYPHTPSLGCLCAPERWSEQTGERMASEQQRLIDALERHGGTRGYVVVVELDDLPRPVKAGDVIPEIASAETGRASPLLSELKGECARGSSPSPRHSR